MQASSSARTGAGARGNCLPATPCRIPCRQCSLPGSTSWARSIRRLCKLPPSSDASSGPDRYEISSAARSLALTRSRSVISFDAAQARRSRAPARGVCRWLERVGEGRDEWAALLAHHYAEAARPEDADLAWTESENELGRVQEKAVRWLRRAAQLAIDRYEVDDSLVLLHRAVEMASSPESSAPIWLEIGNANALKYDGEAFWTAMQRSLEHSTDPATTAKTYSDLAFQASIRGGMWKKHPPPDTVAGWVEQALELTGEETPERTRALIAQASVDREVGEASAREASTLADRLGDPELRSWAWMSRD